MVAGAKQARLSQKAQDAIKAQLTKHYVPAAGTLTKRKTLTDKKDLKAMTAAEIIKADYAALN